MLQPMLRLGLLQLYINNIKKIKFLIINSDHAKLFTVQ